MKTLRLLTLLVIFFLAACATTPPATALPTKETIATAIPPVPSETALPPTAQPSSTPTSEPPTPTSQPTAIPATPTPEAWQQAQTAILPLVAPCNFADQAISYSPAKTWVSVTCQGENGTLTKLARLDGSQQWSLSFDEIFIKPYRASDANVSALMQKSFIPVRWTKNEDFVYLAVQTSSENTPYQGYDGLFRLDLSTGKTRPVLKPSVAPLSATYALQFSPFGNKLAYINQSVQPVTIAIVDTVTGDENKIALDARFTQGGGLLWSQDEKQLVVSALDESTNGGNAVIVYDLETMKNEYIIQQSATTYLPLNWAGANTLYAEKYPGEWVYIDLATGNIRTAPAPTPAP